MPFYTLDVIISVGYRVKSQRGVQFRQWANGVLKQYLLKGYAVNERLRREQIGELRQLVQLVGRTLHNDEMATSALLLHCFFGFSMATECFIILMALSALPIAHLLH